MSTRRRLNQLEEHTRRRAHAVMTAVFNAATDDCRVVARMVQTPGYEPTPEDLDARDRVMAILRAEMERAGFDPDSQPVPGLIDGWQPPAPFARTP